jgi:hypothetical protein
LETEEGSLYEHRSHQLASRHRFALRLLRHLLIAAAIIAVSLLGGILGYEHYEHLAWRDAFLNAAMLLGGMGPIKTDLSEAGKLFAGVYALYSGLVFSWQRACYSRRWSTVCYTLSIVIWTRVRSRGRVAATRRWEQTMLSHKSGESSAAAFIGWQPS